MTTIDQRILIPVPPQTVWEYISNIANNVKWQADSKSVVFLTSRRDGAGLRWRNVTDTGNEQVIEITAWYDGLGYQYTYIDGVPYRASSGTIRIQDTPDGTVVQWTFNYEMGGLLGGMRDSMGISRRIDKVMSDSLKALWREMRSTGQTYTPTDAKSLMRDAPDVSQRSQYKPRHPSITHEKESRQAPTQPRTPPVPADDEMRFAPPKGDERFSLPDTLAAERLHAPIPEPPIADDDTRPRPAVQAALEIQPGEPAPVIEPFPESEPDFLADFIEPELAVDTDPLADTQPTRPIQVEKLTDTPAAAKQSEQAAAVDESAHEFHFEAHEFDLLHFANDVHEDDSDILFAEQAPPAEVEEQPQLLITEEYPRVPVELDEAIFAPTEQHEVPAEPAIAATEAPAPPVVESAPAARIDEPPLSRLDTGKVSIWEVFGLPRPSETQELRAAVVAETESTPAEEAAASALPGFAQPRAGLRAKLRRTSVPVRRPS